MLQLHMTHLTRLTTASISDEAIRKVLPATNDVASTLTTWQYIFQKQVGHRRIISALIPSTPQHTAITSVLNFRKAVILWVLWVAFSGSERGRLERKMIEDRVDWLVHVGMECVARENYSTAEAVVAGLKMPQCTTFIPTEGPIRNAYQSLSALFGVDHEGNYAQLLQKAKLTNPNSIMLLSVGDAINLNSEEAKSTTKPQTPPLLPIQIVLQWFAAYRLCSRCYVEAPQFTNYPLYKALQHVTMSDVHSIEEVKKFVVEPKHQIADAVEVVAPLLHFLKLSLSTYSLYLRKISSKIGKFLCGELPPNQDEIGQILQKEFEVSFSSRTSRTFAQSTTITLVGARCVGTAVRAASPVEDEQKKEKETQNEVLPPRVGQDDTPLERKKLVSAASMSSVQRSSSAKRRRAVKK
jgi:hypothetical protein